MNEKIKIPYGEISPFKTGMAGTCPRCGQGRMLKGVLSVHDKCDACDLDYDFADSGDGPAVFVILILGFIVVGLALIVDVKYAPPLWLHFLLWFPLVIALGIWGLRVCKGLFLAYQYHNKADEGRLSDEDDEDGYEEEDDA